MAGDSGPLGARPREPDRADGQGPPTSRRHRPPEVDESDSPADVTSATFSWVGEARRIDALLRHRFPHLVTKLYEVETNRFLITFDPSLQKASEIEEEFNDSIRFLTAWVDLSNEEPEQHLRVIPPLSDADAIGQLTGLQLTQFDFVNLLLSRFPSVDILDITNISKDRKIHILLAKKLDSDTHDDFVRFVDSLESPADFQIRISPTTKKRTFAPPAKAPLSIVASPLRPHAPSYVRIDEAFWFDNISAISQNEFTLTSFPGFRDDDFRCYLDLTVNQDQMNLRQALLLYDEVWCSLPLESQHADFLKRQAVSESDLLTLAESGRLRFVTTQPEERLNVKFLEAVHERKQTAILGRRTTAALLVSDIVRAEAISYFKDPSVVEILPPLCETLAAHTGRTVQNFYRIFLWPMASLRGGLYGLLDFGSWGSPVRDIAQVLSKEISSIHGVDLGLELQTLSPPVHIAHALEATLFGPLSEPAGWNRLRSWVGWHLSFHKHFNQQTASSWIQNEVRRQQGHLVMPTMRLFDFDPGIPILEIVEDTSLWSTRAKGRSLYSRLADLPDDKRKAEIDALEGKLRKKTRRASRTIISFDTVETIGDAAEAVLGFVWLPVAGPVRLARGIGEELRRVRRLDRAMMRLQERMTSSPAKRDVDFLSRIGRVARFRRDRV